MSKSLEELPKDALFMSTVWDDRGNDTLNQCFDYVGRVKVIKVWREPKKESILLFYGLINKFIWNLALFQWLDAKPLMSYSSNLGRELLQGQVVVPCIIT